MAVSEEIRLPSNGGPLPLGHLLPGLSAHAEDLLKLRIAQPALALVGAHAGRPQALYLTVILQTVQKIINIVQKY